jgi:hypothetical protein
MSKGNNNLGVSYDGKLERDLEAEKQIEYVICESSMNSVILDKNNDSGDNPFHRKVSAIP